MAVVRFFTVLLTVGRCFIYGKGVAAQRGFNIFDSKCAVCHSGPEFTTPSPILLALRSELPAETCSACGYATALHYDTSGLHWLGCTGVAARLRLGKMVSRPLRDTEVWGDQHPGVSLALLDALDPDVTVRADSPCTAAHNPQACGAIGSGEVGCDAQPVTARTWSAVKELYRVHSAP